MKINLIFLMISTLFITRFAAAELKVNSKFGKVVDQCQVTQPKKRVIFIKQWHLPPGANTHKPSISNSTAPQSENQISIYRQLSEWSSQKKLKTLWAEGCSTPDEIKAGYSTPYNGWTLADLIAASKKPKYEAVMTHVALKIEAKFADSVKTLCSDDASLIQESQLALSDARADLGYLSRLTQFKSDPERIKVFLEGAIESFKLPKDSKPEAVIAKVKESLNADVAKLKAASTKRSEKLIEAVMGNESAESVAVWGGLHAKEVKEGLEKAGIGCFIVQPNGYDQDEEKLMESLTASINAY